MYKRGILLTGSITMAILLSGCFQGEESLEDMDPPQNASPVDNIEDGEDNESVAGDGEETSVNETVPRELYLVDANGMVAAQTIELPNPESKEVASQVLEHLVKGGPVTSMLPNGFQAVLPEGTQILGVNLQEDGTIVVDFSEEFQDYDAKEELQILESITHTLTQFENVNTVQLQINGHAVKEMPVNGTPIGEGYSRANGINVTETDTTDLINSKAVTMYYPTEHDENRYYVPVTQYVETNDEEIYASIIQSLLEGPGFNTNVQHVFNSTTLLTGEPTLSDGVLNLTFNEDILLKDGEGVIADEVMETIVRTLTEQQGIEAVDVKVENVEQLVNENGETYEEPVTKQQFTPTEKL
ncbi:GerMN domain-containing protein [Oceanobacillus jordanicus]|uniref:GerMN domain-containing protein n=1 Tax=Oceanobacillus jordanicus TaxID=2867266 RepID=A0AAW5B8U7_9BACI|nr:GerMN domain-containing protein [Oceanobacillus jordanicus]MCG3421058.1 GerMN domain-containing protein [Oceanobacillus jordanicus]